MHTIPFIFTVDATQTAKNLLVLKKGTKFCIPPKEVKKYEKRKFALLGVKHMRHMQNFCSVANPANFCASQAQTTPSA